MDFIVILKWKNTIPLKICLGDPADRILRKIPHKTHFSELSYPLWLIMAKYLHFLPNYSESCCTKLEQKNKQQQNNDNVAQTAIPQVLLPTL